ncbi:hypothetical protein OTC26_028325, partial [Streptomyces tirandamycinicus]|nr:hypothetical protein [Streptomyces tirandamycinicus]
MYGSIVARLLSAAALTWLLTTPLPAAADSCSYASIGPGGPNGPGSAVAIAGGVHCTAGPVPVPEPPPPPPAPPPPPPPPPTPPPPPPEPP